LTRGLQFFLEQPEVSPPQSPSLFETVFLQPSLGIDIWQQDYRLNGIIDFAGCFERLQFQAVAEFQAGQL
jgi:hypothetical protein